MTIIHCDGCNSVIEKGDPSFYEHSYNLEFCKVCFAQVEKYEQKLALENKAKRLEFVSTLKREQL